MRLVNGVRLAGFAAVCIIALVLLAWKGFRSSAVTDVNRHTGREVTIEEKEAELPEPPPPPPLSHLERARATGSAAQAAEILGQAVAGGDADDVERALEALSHELSEPLRDADVSDDPGSRPLADWLAERCRDTDHGSGVEAFFALDAGEADAPDTEAIVAAGDRFDPPDAVAAMAVAAGSAVEPAALDAVARAFQAASRPRARLRWLTRRFAAAPGDTGGAERLAQACVEYGDVQAAYQVLRAAVSAGADRAELAELRAQVALWTSRTGDEAAALEDLPDEPSAERRTRLVKLHTSLGDPDAAYRHAAALADADPNPETLALAAKLAARAGRPAEAMEVLERVLAEHGESVKIRSTIADLAEQNLLLEQAADALEVLARMEPRGGHLTRLEGLCRRAGWDDRLANVLERQLARRPDEVREAELLGLLHGLGRTARMHELAQARMRAPGEGGRFAWELPSFLAAGVPGTLDLAVEMLADDATPAQVRLSLGQALGIISLDPAYAPVVEAALAGANDPTAVAAIRWSMIDRAGTPVEVARRAEELAAGSPDDLETQRMWAERADWAELGGMGLRAWTRVLELEPSDDRAREQVANLLGSSGRYEEAVPHWQHLALAAGPASPAAENLVNALYAVGRDEEAAAWVEQRAGMPGASRADRHALAESYVGNERVDAAVPIYRRLAEEDPEDAVALRRMGEILSWTNDPSGAIPWFVRAIEVVGRGDGELLHLLAEAYWSVNDERRGEAEHDDAIPLLRDPERVNPLRESMLARALVRRGEIEESVEIYERLEAAEPRNQGLRLDHAVSLMIAEHTEDARAVVEAARPLGPQTRRLLRLDGQLLIEERRYDEAVVSLEHYLELHGDDAGVFSDLGRAHDHRGEKALAREAYERVIEIQPENEDVTKWLRRTFDVQATAIEVQMRLLGVEDDSAAQFWIDGSTRLDADRTRLSARLWRGSYTGRARAVAKGTKDIDEDVTALSVALSRRLGRSHEAGGGLDFYVAGRERRDTGAWAAVRLEDLEPYRFAYLRTYRNEVFDDVPAAVGLGGTADGVRLETSSNFGEKERNWVSAAGEWRRLEIRAPGRGRVRDRQARGTFSVGRRLRLGDHVIQDGVTPRHLHPVHEGARVAGEEDEQEGPSVSAWISYEPMRMRDDKRLSRLLPLGDAFDYLTANLLVAEKLADGLTGQIQPYVGTDLRDSGFLGGIGFALAWRPTREVELRLGGGYGRSLGRGDEGAAASLELALTVRW